MSLVLHDIIIKPLQTEKSSIVQEQSNRYTFRVHKNANKFQIREAIERLFDVKIVDIKTSVMHGRVKKAGKHSFRSSSWKKAMVKVRDGQQIQIFQGV